MYNDTSMGGSADRFPQTQRSAVAATRSPDAQVRDRAMAVLVAAYWKPIYKYLRTRKGLNNEDAKDMTQGFFAHAVEHLIFERYDPEKAAFRTYLRVCLDAFTANEFKARTRLKRGGDQIIHSLNFDGAEEELSRVSPSKTGEIDEYFHQECVRSLFSLAVETLREVCKNQEKTVYFKLFEQYDLDAAEPGTRPTYEGLAKQFGLPASQVTNYLAWARREFRRIVLDRLREMTGSDTEFRAEARALLGTDHP